MGGMRIMAAVGVVVGAGLLAGCCLFSGNPTVMIMGPTSATVGQAVTFMAQATGGGGTYTNYVWMGVMGQGAMATHTFQSAGQQMVGVTVTDNCGKTASAQIYVTVTEGTGGGNLTGMWTGFRVRQVDGQSFAMSLQLTHVGTNVTGQAYRGTEVSQGSGSYAAGQFMFTFPWWGTTTMVALTGTFDASANELRGSLMVGNVQWGTWRVMR